MDKQENNKTFDPKNDPIKKIINDFVTEVDNIDKYSNIIEDNKKKLLELIENLDTQNT